MDKKIVPTDVGAMEKDSFDIGVIVNVSATPEEEAKVLAKIDRLYASK